MSLFVSSMCARVRVRVRVVVKKLCGLSRLATCELKPGCDSPSPEELQGQDETGDFFLYPTPHLTANWSTA